MILSASMICIILAIICFTLFLIGESNASIFSTDKNWCERYSIAFGWLGTILGIMALMLVISDWSENYDTSKQKFINSLTPQEYKQFKMMEYTQYNCRCRR